MAKQVPDRTPKTDISALILYALCVGMVVIGLINSTPGIPGYDDLASGLIGIEGATFRKFPFEWFYPAFFSLMMIIVALKHSMWRDWADKATWRRRFGLPGGGLGAWRCGLPSTSAYCSSRARASRGARAWRACCERSASWVWTAATGVRRMHAAPCLVRVDPGRDATTRSAPA